MHLLGLPNLALIDIAVPGGSTPLTAHIICPSHRPALQVIVTAALCERGRKISATICIGISEQYSVRLSKIIKSTGDTLAMLLLNN